MNLGVAESDIKIPSVSITQEIQTVDYLSIYRLVPSFISLDISKTSTGWAKWVNGELTKGTLTLESESNYKDDSEYLLALRKQFRTFLIELFGDYEYEYVFIEDVIGGVNFKTNRVLFQLNPIADDLIEYGLIKAKNLVREDNKVWKKHLRQCSGYVSKIRANSDDKQIVRDSLYLLGFGDGTTNTIKEDIYDAVGMGVGIIYRKFILKEDKPKKKLKKDIGKVYKIHQFSDLYQALDDANEVGGEIHEVNFLNIKKDLRHNFKRLIEDLDDDKKTFVITILTCKIGAVALDKGLNLNYETSYLVVYR